MSTECINNYDPNNLVRNEYLLDFKKSLTFYLPDTFQGGGQCFETSCIYKNKDKKI